MSSITNQQQQQKISNIKYSCKLKEKTPPVLANELKSNKSESDTPPGGLRRILKQFSCEDSSVSVCQPNFFVLRKTYVFVIFFTGHVNVTGCSSISITGRKTAMSATP